MQRSILSRMKHNCNTLCISPAYSPHRHPARTHPYFTGSSRSCSTHRMGSEHRVHGVPARPLPSPQLPPTSFSFAFNSASSQGIKSERTTVAIADGTKPAASAPAASAGASLERKEPKFTQDTKPALRPAVMLKQHSKYADDSWSPFDSPLVQSCVAASGLQQPPSLLESFSHHIPLYTPTQSATNSRESSRPVSPQFTTYAQPPEQVAVQILDLESGEYLKQLPFR